MDSAKTVSASTWAYALDAATQDGALLFTVLMVLLTIVGLSNAVLKIVRRQPLPKVVLTFPNMVIAIGILGTFWGIFVGLKSFDASNLDSIEKSIPALLDGLKIAFVSSIFGMGASLILKFFYTFHESHLETNAPESSNDALTLLRSIKKSTDNLSNVLTKALSSDDDTSMHTHLTKIRVEMIDGRKEVLKAFEEFAEKMAKDGTNELIKALEKVMADFNSLLNKMVGAAFDELKNSVNSLNEWQVEHKEQVQSMMTALSESVKALEVGAEKLSTVAKNLEGTDTHLESVAKSVESLGLDGDQLAHAIETLSRETEVFQTALKEIEAVGQEAAKVFPDLEKNLAAFSTNLETVMTEQNASTAKLIEEQQGLTTKMSEGVEEQITHIRKAQTEQQELMKEGLEKLEKELENSLTQSMSSMVGAMTTISERFAEDYTPLANRLREIVALAEDRKA